jgi:hypothetical protein
MMAMLLYICRERRPVVLCCVCVSRIPRYFTQRAYLYRDMYRITPIWYCEISSILLIFFWYIQSRYFVDTSDFFGIFIYLLYRRILVFEKCRITPYRRIRIRVSVSCIGASARGVCVFYIKKLCCIVSVYEFAGGWSCYFSKRIQAQISFVIAAPFVFCSQKLVYFLKLHKLELTVPSAGFCSIQLPSSELA